MLKQLSNVIGAKNLTKDAQKEINGGVRRPKCGGDGSFIIQDGKVVCCYVGPPNLYLC